MVRARSLRVLIAVGWLASAGQMAALIAALQELWARCPVANGQYVRLAAEFGFWMLLSLPPLLLAVLITLAVYVPALIRGERVAPGEPSVEDQWFGGPRKGTSELAGPDTDESKAGGASGRW